MKSLTLILVLLGNITVYGQNDSVNHCRYPFFQSADSLVKFVIKDIYGYHSSKKVNRKFNSVDFQKSFYNPELKPNYDSIFHICINHLETHLGKRLLCKNVDMYLNSFYLAKDQKHFGLNFGFTYPVLKRQEPVRIGNFTSYYERIIIEYHYSINNDGTIDIQYPNNVPYCLNKDDCNINITREKALEILKHWGLIKENDTVGLTIDGIYWHVSLTSNGWISRHLSINIQTGKLSNFYTSHRID